MSVSRWAARQAGQDPNITAEELTETANRLLHRQFITRGDPGGASHFDRVVGNLDYFKDLFASFGFRFIFNDAWGYVGYVSPVAFNNSRVSTQETIVLLCLRLLYSEGAEKGYFVDSTAQILVEEEELRARGVHHLHCTGIRNRGWQPMLHRRRLSRGQGVGQRGECSRLLHHRGCDPALCRLRSPARRWLRGEGMA